MAQSFTLRRTVAFITGAVALALVYALGYQRAMLAFEGVRVGFVEALFVVSEAFTTIGFGRDTALWTTPEMLLTVILMELTGVALVFLTVPAFVLPLVEETLSPSPPTDTDLTDHVVVCTFTARGRSLTRELQSRDQPYVVVVPDGQRALELAADHDVVHGDPEEVATLQAANIGQARALVADEDDEANASIVLSAREVTDDVRIVSVVEDESNADYHRYAGADEVVSARRLLGESLAAKATPTVADELIEGAEIDGDFQVAELLVHRGSTLAGQTLADCRIGERTGANVIGAWHGPEFVSPPPPDDIVDEHTVLLAAGRESELEELKNLTLAETRRQLRGPVVVIGAGVVGSTIRDELVANDDVVVVDQEDGPLVDVVGDATAERTLEEAGVSDARAVIIAVDSDRTATFVTLAVKQLAPDTEVLARAQDEDNVAKLYRAGAEYVLALSTVSGRLLASSLLDEEVLRAETQVDVVRTTAPGLAGKRLDEADVRNQTGATVVAVQRNGTVMTEVAPDTRIETDDTLIIVGTDEAVTRFAELYT